jgi:putative sterol carrier protein
VGIRFLSPEYMEHATRIMSDPGFAEEVGDLELLLQLTTIGVPGEGDVDYVIAIVDGSGEMRRGRVEQADATIRQTYETACGLARGEVNPAAAFMTGRLRVSGNVAKLMRAQEALRSLQDRLAELDIEY